MTPSFATIITPLDPQRVEACGKFLRENTEPRSLSRDGNLNCGPLFRFDLVKSLHFCSFLILNQGLPPQLVFEATFDGDRDDFLSELLRVVPQGIAGLYGNCIGYPATGLATPELVKEYLVNHDVGAHTFFRGSPGRGVGQVRRESRLRSGLISFLDKQWPNGQRLPSRSPGVVDSVRNFIRGNPQSRWAEEPVRLPWEMTARKAIAAAVVIAAAVIAAATGALALYFVWDIGPLSLKTWIDDFLGFLKEGGGRIAQFVPTDLPGSDYIRAGLQSPIASVLVSVGTLWLGLRVAELFLVIWTRDPRKQFFHRRLLLHLLIASRYALAVAQFGFIVLLGADFSAPSLFMVLPSLLGIAATVTLLAYLRSSLKLAAEWRRPDPVGEAFRRLRLDLVQFLMGTAVVLGGLLIASLIPLGEGVKDVLRAAPYVALVLVAYALAGMFVLYTVWLAVFWVIRVRELLDIGKYADAAELTVRASVNAKKYEREEGGINQFQNHLASITCVKPGWLRWVMLHSALFGINLLARFWYNRGELGGIGTILSARWVVIDRGRRLLFLDNFGGAWESYLNEFIDMSAVKGLNAIWSNTFVTDDSGRKYAFPPTRFLLWRGAQAERPFKAYVRQSQVETIAWYSAYPTLGVNSINGNTALRQAVFGASTLAEAEAVLQRL